MLKYLHHWLMNSLAVHRQMINLLLAADNKLSDYLLALKVLLEPMVEPMITIPS